MQYHLNGYRSGDPAIAIEAEKTGESSDKVDVLIVGCGPAGLTLAAQLAVFPDINTRIVDKKTGPLTVGQADGVACRSMEMFEAFGFADRVKKEAYWVNEVVFWRPVRVNKNTASENTHSDNKIVRADRIQDVEAGLSEMPHTILNQARIHDFYLQCMCDSARGLVPEYGLTLVDVSRENSREYPVKAVFETASGGTETLYARYAVGCDGARSTVRASLGQELKGEAARQLWGVMDVLAVTDFPDIRLKAAIQSAESGSLLVIPREGGYMVRLYIEIDELHGSERASDRKLTAQDLIDKAQAILDPYTLEVKEIAWWSAYEIGQRVCDIFDDRSVDSIQAEPRIFIAGDACHTHSPKAGQGMNVSMADAFNLGWKLASVLKKQAGTQLLNTYSDERQAKARELIDFDRDMAKLFSAKPGNQKSDKVEQPEKFQQYFKKHGRYTAGVETKYSPSMITVESKHQAQAAGFPVGMRFHSAPVVRLADARPMELGHVLKADGRWRLIAFAPSNDSGVANGAIARLCDYLQHDSASPVVCFTPQDSDPDAVIDLRVVFQQNHRDMDFESLPDLLKPAKGRYGLKDYEKVFCEDTASGHNIFDMRSINRDTGALIVVRPDQYVSGVFTLDDRDLYTFFSRFQCSIP